MIGIVSRCEIVGLKLLSCFTFEEKENYLIAVEPEVVYGFAPTGTSSTKAGILGEDGFIYLKLLIEGVAVNSSVDAEPHPPIMFILNFFIFGDLRCHSLSLESDLSIRHFLS